MAIEPFDSQDILPFQGETVVGILTRRVAAGWLMLPFQGEYFFNLKQKLH
ncbi:MAG: hypothetical protein LBF88_01365 [Planctomycetaceae bacterium]|jgi:hypothetical protein|nr:hypothetical protein [Planctomycetaceae bacterium]